MMKLNLDLSCRDVNTDINYNIYKMDWDTCFVIESAVRFKQRIVSGSISPGKIPNSLYVISIRGNSKHLLQSINNKADIFNNKKLIVKYADKHKI